MTTRSPAARPPRKLGHTLEFMRLLWTIEHELQTASKRMETRLGITGPQRLALRVVVRFPGQSAKHLADVLRLHPSTLTGVLRRLEDGGLIVRRVDPEDGRGIRLSATAAGRALTSSPAGTVEASVRRALRRIAPHELSAARHVLTALADALREP